MRAKGYKEWANVIGLRYDEPKRVAKQRKQNDSGKNKWTSLVPLYDNKVMVEDVALFWEKNEFDLKLPNHSGKTLAGNCDLCFLKGTRTLIKLIKEKPELADWWIEQEQKISKPDEDIATFNKSRSYTDLVELAKFDSLQTSLFEDDARSCFCHD